jgi:hypothetical protein
MLPYDLALWISIVSRQFMRPRAGTYALTKKSIR